MSTRSPFGDDLHAAVGDGGARRRGPAAPSDLDHAGIAGLDGPHLRQVADLAGTRLPPVDWCCLFGVEGGVTVERLDRSSPTWAGVGSPLTVMVVSGEVSSGVLSRRLVEVIALAVMRAGEDCVFFLRLNKRLNTDDTDRETGRFV